MQADGVQTLTQRKILVLLSPRVRVDIKLMVHGSLNTLRSWLMYLFVKEVTSCVVKMTELSD